ncbi:Saccharopine dehydrogenase [Fusarium circinatum]|uniref:Saccharopine dehydrogenase [NAD(+), L-lysine-forming] n=1 Tax=Fusarium circinatum TaxID=48490 RepID=A0A8H5X448_FUSCI|nr:Saccharopine dehydrogenase [Fusarium circinatum]
MYGTLTTLTIPSSNQEVSPATAQTLVDAGYVVRVEESPDRIYKINEFRAVGAEIVPTGSWVKAPKEDIILGLKEIEADGSMFANALLLAFLLTKSSAPLPHTYIHFAHVYKKQTGWATELSRFSNAGGLLYDLEFLTDENGRRVAAFGYWAGFAGTALALLSWAHQLLNSGVPQGSVPVVDSASALTELVKDKVDAARSANDGALPRLIVIGALGRCGKGAIAAAEAIGVSDILKWDIAETSKGGPFPEVASSDIFVNCVYLGSNKIPPFTTFEALSAPDRRLRVICDVSCDPNSENNPIPVYSSYSSFENPTVPASEHIDKPELRIIAIDHLPTMVARRIVKHLYDFNGGWCDGPSMTTPGYGGALASVEVVQACDNENRPIDELWNERFREEFSKSGHLQSESDKAEWVYWANHLKTADSTKTLYNHLLGKAGTGGNHRRMSWACICAVLCNPRWSEESIRIGSKGKGWAARAAAAYSEFPRRFPIATGPSTLKAILGHFSLEDASPNANIWRGQPKEEQADAAIAGQPDTDDEAQNARYKSQLKAKRDKAHGRSITQRMYDRMRKKAKKAQKAKSSKSRDTGGEMKKLQDALHRRDRMIKESDATIKLLKSKLSEQKELFEGSDPRIRSATLSPSRSATLSPGPGSSPTLSPGRASN